ncbi:MAG: hypothetical protein ABI885_10755, partial [Gammaproteobacteria bacterium]
MEALARVVPTGTVKRLPRLKGSHELEISKAISEHIEDRVRRAVDWRCSSPILEKEEPRSMFD